MSTSNQSFSPGSGSEKENPRPRVNKGKRPMRDSAQPPTPDSSETNGRASKRRRISDEINAPLTDGALDDEEDEDEEEGPPTPSVDDPDALLDVTDEHQRVEDRTADVPPSTGRKKKVRFYDPNQPEGERRAVKRQGRQLEREFNENRDEYLRPNNDGLTSTIERADRIFDNVKQTADATNDSRLMVNVSEITHRKSAQLVLADSATGIDVDDFVSKCISFMRRGASEATQASMTSTQRRRAREEQDDEDDPAEFFDWTYLGNHACHPFNARPAVTSFLLGPLSVQKRVRAPTQRRAKQRDDGRAETRPEALERADLETNETNTVRHVCAKIKTRLQKHCERGEARVRAQVQEDMTDEEMNEVFRANRMTSVGGPSLFDFVVDPHSFGQTVENLFYVSFLIKEGEVGVTMDDDDLPALVLNHETVDQARQRKSTKHQAVFGIDYETWKQLKEAYEIKEGLIPHREEGEARVGTRGWYS